MRDDFGVRVRPTRTSRGWSLAPNRPRVTALPGGTTGPRDHRIPQSGRPGPPEPDGSFGRPTGSVQGSRPDQVHPGVPRTFDRSRASAAASATRFVGLFCQPAGGLWPFVAVCCHATESAKSPVPKGNRCKTSDAGDGLRRRDTAAVAGLPHVARLRPGSERLTTAAMLAPIARLIRSRASCSEGCP